MSFIDDAKNNAGEFVENVKNKAGDIIEDAKSGELGKNPGEIFENVKNRITDKDDKPADADKDHARTEAPKTGETVSDENLPDIPENLDAPNHPDVNRGNE